MNQNQAIPAHYRGGFTIIEVLIIVMILGITAALAIPMLSDTNSTKLIAAADLLATDLAYTEIESISHSDDPRVVVFDSTNSKYIITTRSAITTAVGAGNDPIDATPINNPVGNQPYEVILGQRHAVALGGVTISSYSLNGDEQLEFGIYGQTDQAATATITFAAGTSNIDVTLEPISGEASIGTIY